MSNLDHLFRNNKRWADKVSKEDPTFFKKLAQQQSPEILWIGCSDSRVPANQITGLLPGEVFVHRNVANLVVHTDFNCLSVMQYAVEVLKVKHIIVCGHYGCGGVQAVHDRLSFGLIDNWLRNIQDVQEKHAKELRTFKTRQERLDKLCELNVVEQVANVAANTIIQKARQRKQSLTIHGWIYSIKNGRLRKLITVAR